MASGTAALAQNTVPAQPLPGLDSFSLPSNRPAPRVAPSPEPTTNPRPVETETVAPPVVAPTTRATAAPRATPTPARTAPAARATLAARPTPIAKRTPAPRPTGSATPVAAPLPVPSSTPTAAPAETQTPAPVAQPSVAPAAAPGTTETGSGYLWPAIAGGLALAVAIGLALWWRRRAARETPAYEEGAVVEDVPTSGDPVVAAPQMASAPEPAPTLTLMPVPAPIVPDAVTAARAAITFELTPKRAGTNLLSAAVEYQIVVRNNGDADATGIRLDIRLLSAGAQQDATIAALFAAPIDRPITAPFDLPAGVAVELSGMALHPKASLEVMEMGGKAMFVPVLTVVAEYDWADGSGRTARSYLVGIDRGAGGKLAPFRIDSGARMYDTVRAIEYTVPA